MSASGAGVAERLAALEARIAEACRRVGRDPAGVRLVGVAKGQPIERIRAAVAAGLGDLGENYVQEWQGRRHDPPLGGLRWHFIGALQRRKARAVVGEVDLIHAVDRAALIDELAVRAVAAGVRQRVLLQVNVAREATKAGADPDEALLLAERVARADGLALEGLTVMPPAADDAEAARRWFAAARALLDRAVEAGLVEGPPALSMGTSGDFEVAIEEGATLVRLGTALFGPRP